MPCIPIPFNYTIQSNKSTGFHIFLRINVWFSQIFTYYSSKSIKKEFFCMWQQIFLGFAGICSGVIIAGGAVGLMIGLSILPRYAGITHTADSILLTRIWPAWIRTRNLLDLWDLSAAWSPFLILYRCLFRDIPRKLDPRAGGSRWRLPCFSRRIRLTEVFLPLS